MNNNYISSLNGGGGNSLNIINIYSKNIFDKIIKSSDLNGCIVPYDKNVWHIITPNHWVLCQDNIQNKHLYYHTPNEIANSWTDKSQIGIDGFGGMFFQFKYKE